MSPVEPPGPGESAVLGGKIRLLQPAKGYRAGLDAALLAAACDARNGERVLELGCGVGGALLPAAVRCRGAQFTGVERDADATDLARRNVELNALSHRVDVRAGEVAQGFRALGVGRVDLAMANPPFFDDPASLRAPAPAKRDAWMADDGLAAWVGYLLDAVKDGGRVLMIHRADRLPGLLAALTPRAGSIQLRPVHPYADEPAKRVLVRAARGGRAPFRLLPPLILHDRSGSKHTAKAEAILRGEAGLPWS